jgi:hypothetical protein
MDRSLRDIVNVYFVVIPTRDLSTNARDDISTVIPTVMEESQTHEISRLRSR